MSDYTPLRADAGRNDILKDIAAELAYIGKQLRIANRHSLMRDFPVTPAELDAALEELGK